MIDALQSQASLKRLCAVFDCPRSTYSYRPKERDETALVRAIEPVLMRRPWFGYRRGVAQLQREGVQVGETLVRRLLKTLGHTCSVGQVRVATTDSRHPYTRYANLIKGLTLKQPNPVSLADIPYIRWGLRFIYLAVILDAYSRSVRGWALSRSLSQDLTLDALKMALSKGPPLMFHSDQGSPYSAWLPTDMLDAAGVRMSLSDKGKPLQNGIAERFMRSLKEEHVDYADSTDFPDALRQIAQWIEVEFNTQRIHSALNYATPTEFQMAAHTSSSPSC